MATVDSMRPHFFRVDRRSLNGDDDMGEGREEDVEWKEEDDMITLSLFMVALRTDQGRTRGGGSV